MIIKETAPNNFPVAASYFSPDTRLYMLGSAGFEGVG
jgi:hypothetical protein